MTLQHGPQAGPSPVWGEGRVGGALQEDPAEYVGDSGPSPLWGEGRVRGALGKNPAGYAREVRRGQTDAERKWWVRLRDRQLGAKFRRQHPIGPHIVDFCCPERRLVIELDGGHHARQREHDARRTEFLAANGYRLLRFWNVDVFANLDGILDRIGSALRDPHPRPLPRRERGKGQHE
jgi:very-short-patch-repair endonuclease